MTKFSVLMSIYHKENPEYFKLALNSIWSQTLQPSEIILIEDGPLTPELYSVIKTYSENWPIFKIIINEKNLGLGPSLAKGVLASSNEFIFRMDTDDMAAPDRFEKQLPFLEQGYDAVGCRSVAFMDELDHIIGSTKKPEKHDDIVKRAHHRTPIGHPGSAFRKSSVINAGNYRDNWLFEDYDLWIRMIVNGCKFYCVQEQLLYFRYSLDTAKRRGGWKYVKNEIGNFINFRRIGFYSTWDLIRNTLTVSMARLTPIIIRNIIHKIYMNTQSSDYSNIKLIPPKTPKWLVAGGVNLCKQDSYIYGVKRRNAA